MNSARARQDGKYFILLGAIAFLLVGIVIELQSGGSLEDFKSLYYSTRTLIEGHDAYRPAEVMAVYLRESREDPSNSTLRGEWPIISTNVYPPATLLLISPLALLGWTYGHALWMILIASCTILAAWLIWDLAADWEPAISGILVGLLLGDSYAVLVSGNPAGVIVGLCIIAVWCFVRKRFELAGVLFMAVGLSVKPHDVWLVWLCLFLSGGLYRRRAWQTAACAAILNIPAILWLQHVAPDYLHEFRSNLAAVSGATGINNPAPSSLSSHTSGMIIDFQTIFSVFRDDPRFYNTASYLLFTALLAVWLFASWRTRRSLPEMLLALAVLSSFTVLPVYHRTYDARLLLLSIPALAMLWAERRSGRWFALAFTTAGVIFTGDLVLAILVMVTDRMHFRLVTTLDKIQFILATRPLPLLIAALGCCYLLIYLRWPPERRISN